MIISSEQGCFFQKEKSKILKLVNEYQLLKLKILKEEK
ncbi:hypothetical protein ES705_48586 [subsurface metagenome]